MLTGNSGQYNTPVSSYDGVCHIIYPYRVVLKLCWYSQGLNFTNGISIFNHEFVYHKILKNLDITYIQNTLQIYIIFSIYGVLALSHQCECVRTKITSIREKLLYLETGVLDLHDDCTLRKITHFKTSLVVHVHHRVFFKWFAVNSCIVSTFFYVGPSCFVVL